MVNDNSCDYSCRGCTDQNACNFNAGATINDNSCDYSCRGCTDRNACNFNAGATINDNSCVYNCRGCTNPLASNFNPSATMDDSSCVMPIFDNLREMCPVIDHAFAVTSVPNGNFGALTTVQFVGQTQQRIDWVDLHYTIISQSERSLDALDRGAVVPLGQPWINVRMSRVGDSPNTFEQPNLIVPAGQSLRFFFTYCVNLRDCDTEVHLWPAA
jgi:hypothetical protein